jgi:hypothetical protein
LSRWRSCRLVILLSLGLLRIVSALRLTLNVASEPQRTSGDLGYAVLRVDRCQMTSGAINVSAKFKKKFRTIHRDDVGRSCNIFQFGMERLYLSGARRRQQRFINQPQPPIQPAHTIVNEPEKQLRRVVKHRNDDCYDCHEHCDESSRVIGHPERQIPIQERRTISVEIAGSLGNGIFRIGLGRKFANLSKKPRRVVRLKGRLHQKIDHCRVNVLARQQDIRCRNKSGV